MTTTKMPKHNRLKTAHEPIVVAQKPYEGSLKDNHEKWGCGLIDSDNNRIPLDKEPPKGWVPENENYRLWNEEWPPKLKLEPPKGRPVILRAKVKEDERI